MFGLVVGRALPAFTINVDCISVGSAHPTNLLSVNTGGQCEGFNNLWLKVFFSG